MGLNYEGVNPRGTSGLTGTPFFSNHPLYIYVAHGGLAFPERKALYNEALQSKTSDHWSTCSMEHQDWLHPLPYYLRAEDIFPYTKDQDL
jgi:hypothetical protein